MLEKGGLLAWGIIPTSGAIKSENTESIKERFNKGIEKLSHKINNSLIYSNILLTPSCGTGSMTIDETIRVFQLLIRLKEEFA